LNTREVTQRYRLNQWIKRIQECRSSGQTVTAWCKEHNIRQSSYFYWLKRIRQAACEALPSIQEGDHPIVPLTLPTSVVDFGPTDEDSSPGIVVHCGAVTLEIRNTASPTLIENTLRALHYVR